MRERVAMWLAILVLALVAAPAAAWGPGGHAAVAMGVAQARGVNFPTEYLLLQAVYGSSAADLAWQADEPLRTQLGVATHDDPGYLEPWDLAFPWSQVQRSFAWGWLTHNQAWGADHYAHIASPLVPGADGYIVERAAVLAGSQGIGEEAAHDYVEVAVDLLLDRDLPDLDVGTLIGNAACLRDWQVPFLLIRSYADVPGASRLRIRGLELGFRWGLAIYGGALSLPAPQDEAAFAAGLALRYGLTMEKSATCLGAAKSLCQADYWDALASTAELVAAGPWP